MAWLLLAVSLTIGCGTVEDSRETLIKPGWTLSTPLYGGKSGQTSIEVFFPKAGENLPLTFGIPLGQVQSTENIVLTDESGVEIPASFMPLENWATQPSHWTLASTVLSADKDRSQKRFTIKWGNNIRPETFSEMAHKVDDSKVTVENSMYSLAFSPSGIETIAANDKSIITEQWRPTFMPLGEKPLVPDNGILTVLRDSPSYKKFRFATLLSESLELHQEFDVYAGSRFIQCSMRFINRTLKDIPLEGISPLEFSLEGIRNFQINVGGNVPLAGKRFSLHQRAFDSYCILDGERHSISENDRTDICIFTETENGPDILLVFPYFRGMAAGEKELESIISYDGECLRVIHYNHISPNADVRLRETMARTFTYWLIIDPPKEEVSVYANAAAAMPHVIYDREHITEMGVLQEHSVSHLYDSETLEGALYFKRAMVPRAEYPRCGRGTEPEYDGEGATETNLHAGGMVFGEVFQYFTPEPSQGLIEKYSNQLGFDTEHIITGGSYAYRNGDIPLALFQEYLRTGNRKIYDLARIHTFLFADYAVSHAPVPSEGIGHYYCDWYGNPYVYERFEGLLLGYLVTGETWFFETAQAMADFTVRAWKDGAPRDTDMSGNLI